MNQQELDFKGRLKRVRQGRERVCGRVWFRMNRPLPTADVGVRDAIHGRVRIDGVQTRVLGRACGRVRSIKRNHGKCKHRERAASLVFAVYTCMLNPQSRIQVTLMDGSQSRRCEDDNHHKQQGITFVWSSTKSKAPHHSTSEQRNVYDSTTPPNSMSKAIVISVPSALN